MHIIFIPLDERPVNVDIPQQVAAIAGVSIEFPSVRDLPSMRSAANLKNLHAWMLEQAGDKSATHLIACVDTVVHGGLIPGRISHESFGAVIERLEVFRMMKQRVDVVEDCFLGDRGVGIVLAKLGDRGVL